MALHLGIDIGSERTVAAVERDGTPGVLRLGTEAAMPSVAHVAADGSVTVGEAAFERARTEPAGLVPDVAGRLGEGSFTVQGLEVDGGLLVGHLLADIVARVVARHGRRPDAVQLVHPDGWTLDQVDELLTAADDAGLTAISAIGVSEARAALRRRRLAAGEPDHEAAIGAAVVAASAATEPSVAPPAGIVTREDLEGPAPAPPARPVPRYEADGPRSVFDTQVAGAAGVPPTAAIPTVAAGGGGGGGWPDDPYGGDGGDDDDGNARWIWAAVAGVAAVVVVLVLVLLLSGGDDGDDVATTTTTAVPSSTTVGPTTTGPATTTTLAATTTLAPTTTAAPTTTTSSTTTTTTTAPPALGAVGVSDFGIVLRPGQATSDDVLFGEDPDTTVTLVRGLLGAPSSDSGWVVDDVCEGSKTRRVRWGALELTFTQVGADGDASRTREFTQWFVDNTSTEPAGLETLERVGVGDRIEAWENAYGDDLTLEVGSGGRGYFQVAGPSDGVLEGVTSGIAPVDVVLRIWSGSACERPL